MAFTALLCRSDRMRTVQSSHHLLYRTQFYRRETARSTADRALSQIIGLLLRVSQEPFGVGLYLLASVLDHSCVPNCAAVFNGRLVEVVAMYKINIHYIHKENIHYIHS